MRESLAGRAERVLLLPFSLNTWEFGVTAVSSALHQREMEKQLPRGLVCGSYPEVFFSDQPELILNRLLEAFVIRDASDTFGIKHIAKIRQLPALIAGQLPNRLICLFYFPFPPISGADYSDFVISAGKSDGHDATGDST